MKSVEVTADRRDARIFLLAGAVFATATDAYVIVGILPLLADGLDASESAVGDLIAAYMVTFALGSPLLAAMSAGWKRGPLIVACLLFFAAADAICAAAPGFLIFLAARILAACCSATYTPAAFSMAVALSPKNRRGAGLAVVGLGLVGAPLCGVPLGIWVGYHLGWRATFVLDMSLVALAAVALWLAHTPQTAALPSPGLKARLAPLTNRRVIGAILPSVLWGAAYNSIFSYVSVLFVPPLEVGSLPWLFVCVGLGGLVGSQLGGWLADRFGMVASIFGCLCVGGLDIAFLNIVGGTFIGAAVALLVLSCCSWALFPAQQSLLLALEPNHSAVMLSLNNSASYLGIGAGAAAGALILARASAPMLPYAASAIMMAAFAVWLVGVAARAQPRRLPD